MSWTDERVELLKKLWGEGQSANQIAKELGGVTRNAVIGKVHRLGLSNRASSGSKAETTQKVDKKPERSLKKPEAATKDQTKTCHAISASTNNSGRTTSATAALGKEISPEALARVSEIEKRQKE